jgi:lipopolysaccharide export system permease protein
VKIISKYILREHVGPFIFALTALTSLMILNFISRQFGELVGKGLPASVIGEFFALSVPFTVALTLPMSVLVAVLYAFSRLAAENEVTALKASGVSPWRLVTPALVWGFLMSLFLLAFNDQVLPRANFRLKTLQDDIAQTKPTFLLKPQVINAVQEGKLYLKAGRIDQSTGQMREVVIYDLADPTRRRTIYADRGLIQFASNQKDLDLELYHGQMHTVATDKPGQLDRLFFVRDRIKIRDVTGQFARDAGDTLSRGDRELGVCAMQKRLIRANAIYKENRREYGEALRLARLSAAERSLVKPEPVHLPAVAPVEPKNLAWAYCRALAQLVGVKKAEAAEVRSAGLHAFVQDTVRRRFPRSAVAQPDSAQRAAAQRDSAQRATADSATRRATPAAPGSSPQQGTVILGTSRPPAPGTPGATPVPSPIPTPAASQPQKGAPAKFSDPFLARTKADSDKAIAEKQKIAETEVAQNISRTAEVKLRYEMSQRTKNRYEVEINQKFSLAAACLIFVLLCAPLAIRFPRGGVGLVLLASLVVFALYYVGLIGGESLANKGIIPPFWAMWGTNVVLTLIGLVLLLRMGHEENSGRGGNWADRFDKVAGLIRRRRQPMLVKEAA